MHLHRSTVLRTALALFTGCLVAGISLGSAADVTRMYLEFPRSFNRRYFKTIDKALVAYRKTNEKLPSSLSQLSTLSSDYSSLVHKDGSIHDGWDHPFIYEAKGTDYLLISYGRDGKAGGTGLDCDQSNKNPSPAEAYVPFLQVISDPMSQGIVKASLISGLLTALLTFFTVKFKEPITASATSVIVKLIIILIACLFVATTITFLHIPSGH